jgi:hypothetical protein
MTQGVKGTFTNIAICLNEKINMAEKSQIHPRSNSPCAGLVVFAIA